MAEAKAIVEECQNAWMETKAKVGTKFQHHQTYPTQEKVVKIPSIVAKKNENILSNESPLLMDHMLEEDPVMKRLT